MPIPAMAGMTAVVTVVVSSVESERVEPKWVPIRLDIGVWVMVITTVVVPVIIIRIIVIWSNHAAAANEEQCHYKQT